MNLEGRTALVTGSARGIGRAIALDLARAGADIVVNFRTSEALAQETVTAIEALGRRAVGVQADVGRADEVERLAASATEAFETIDILVNNAGITRDKPVTFMTEEEWDAVLDVDLKGPFLCSKALAKGMARKRWGRIINIGSVAGLMGDAMRANYAAAKAGIDGLTMTLARELAPSGITVNAVAPGIIETDMIADMKESRRAKALERIPMSTFGQPQDVAEVVTFLASEESRYITGQVIRVDGGLRIG